jgi:hypothetical protein
MAVIDIITKELRDEATETETDSVFELALLQKERTAGFAFLFDAMVDSVTWADSDELRGVARLAADIAEKSAELCEAARSKDLAAQERENAGGENAR